MLNSTTLQGTSPAMSAAESYTDLSSLNAIRDLGRVDKNLALEKVSRQFESMMVRMMMKSMREANNVFAEGNFLSSNEGDMYQGMYDDQLALSLSQSRGIGVAEIMVRQLWQKFGDATDEEKTPNLSNYFDKPAVLLKNSAADALPAAASAQAKSIDRVQAQSFDGSIEDFVKKIFPMAEKAAAALGVSPELLVAQSALETGWGTRISKDKNGESSLNLFNIKADARWHGAKVSVQTLEFKEGIAVREVAEFRSYRQIQHSFDDYTKFISSHARYRDALAADDGRGYITALKNAGYATDPRYAEKVMAIVDGQSLKTAVKALQAGGEKTTGTLNL